MPVTTFLFSRISIFFGRNFTREAFVLPCGTNLQLGRGITTSKLFSSSRVCNLSHSYFFLYFFQISLSIIFYSHYIYLIFLLTKQNLPIRLWNKLVYLYVCFFFFAYFSFVLFFLFALFLLFARRHDKDKIDVKYD